VLGLLEKSFPYRIIECMGASALREDRELNYSSLSLPCTLSITNGCRFRQLVAAKDQALAHSHEPLNGSELTRGDK